MKQIPGVPLVLVTLAIIVVYVLPMKPLEYTRYDTVPSPVIKPLEVPLEPKLKASNIREDIVQFLESKNSPLVNHVDTLMEQEHWKLILAISAIESSYCKRQLNNNCWGITDTSGEYKSYPSFEEAIIDTNGLITRWQARGRWLSIDDLNGHYVVPANQNWVNLVTLVLSQMNEISCHDHLDSNTLNQPKEKCL